jgi:hypothetical protein
MLESRLNKQPKFTPAHLWRDPKTGDTFEYGARVDVGVEFSLFDRNGQLYSYNGHLGKLFPLPLAEGHEFISEEFAKERAWDVLRIIGRTEDVIWRSAALERPSQKYRLRAVLSTQSIPFHFGAGAMFEVNANDGRVFRVSVDALPLPNTEPHDLRDFVDAGVIGTRAAAQYALRAGVPTVVYNAARLFIVDGHSVYGTNERGLPRPGPAKVVYRLNLASRDLRSPNIIEATVDPKTGTLLGAVDFGSLSNIVVGASSPAARLEPGLTKVADLAGEIEILLGGTKIVSVKDVAVAEAGDVPVPSDAVPLAIGKQGVWLPARFSSTEQLLWMDFGGKLKTIRPGAELSRSISANRVGGARKVNNPLQRR